MKFLRLISILFILSLYNSNSVAAETRDCSEIKTDTLIGMFDKHRCKSGKPPREKKAFGDKLKSLFKKKN